MKTIDLSNIFPFGKDNKLVNDILNDFLSVTPVVQQRIARDTLFCWCVYDRKIKEHIFLNFSTNILNKNHFCLLIEVAETEIMAGLDSKYYHFYSNISKLECVKKHFLSDPITFSLSDRKKLINSAIKANFILQIISLYSAAEYKVTYEI